MKVLLNMGFLNLVKDSFRYTTSDWLHVLILGVVIFLAENLDSFHGNSTVIIALNMVLIVVVAFFIFIEAGYFFRIMEETVEGSINPPRFNKLHELLSHGAKEVIIFFIYFSIPIIILFLAAFEFQTYLYAIFMNPQMFAHYVITDIIFYYLIPNLTPNQFDPEFLTFIVAALLAAIVVYFIFIGSLLNMAFHHGTIRSGLDIRRIYKILTKVGFGKLLLIYIILASLTLLLGVDFFSNLDMLPSFYDWNILDLILQLIVIPYLLIFTIRLLGLVGKENQNNL